MIKAQLPSTSEDIEHDDDEDTVMHYCGVIVFHATYWEPSEYCGEEAVQYDPIDHEWQCPKHAAFDGMGE